MAQVQHTPGPWLDPETLDWLVEPKRLLENAADARILGSAPDLLVALKTIALHAPSLNVAGIREICDEAIAKAEGSTNA